MTDLEINDLERQAETLLQEGLEDLARSARAGQPLRGAPVVRLARDLFKKAIVGRRGHPGRRGAGP